MVNIASLQELSSNYSTIAAILLASVSAFTFIIMIVTEKAISSQFDKHDKEMSLRLERRSRFEEAVLLDRYRLICNLETKIGKVATNLNRIRKGIEVPGFIVGEDIVPLTEVFEKLAASRYLLTDKFHKILRDQSQILIQVANEQDAEILENLENEYLRVLDEFHLAINGVFGIDRITWERLQA